MATMLNPNAIPDGSITQEKIDASVLEAKQDVIDDLETIRSNANKGSTALQSYTESDPVYIADKPKIALKSEIPDISGLATKEEVASKQDALTPGNGISIENNKIGVTTITASENQPSTHLWVNPSEDAETNVTYNRSQIDALVGSKQDTLQLTVKDNGNIVLANIQGQSKEFMPATPSGDPMHYAYEAAGAIWNGTGADITRIGRMTGDTIIHKAGYWYLNELGDISTKEMQKIFIQGRNSDCLDCTAYSVAEANPLRTNLYPLAQRNRLLWSRIEVLVIYGNPEKLGYEAEANYQTIYSANGACRKVLTKIKSKTFRITKESSLYNLEFIKLSNMAVSQYIISPYFREDCILYMIENEAATSAITVTLHADVYAKAMANADIVAALEAHPNVSLASA